MDRVQQISANKQFAEMIGFIIMHWNNLHDTVLLCLPLVLGGDSRFAGPMLDEIKSDETQRRVVLAAIKAILVGDQHADLLKDATNLFKKIGLLSSQRNGFTHSSWTRSAPSVSIGPTGFFKKVHGGLKGDPLLQGAAFLQEVNSARDEVFRLMGRLQEAARSIAEQKKFSEQDDGKSSLVGQLSLRPE